MNFDELYEKISPRLKRVARYHNGHGHFIDDGDLYQEMCLYLWDHYKNGMPQGVNEAYIVKGCEFHILNYLRKNRDAISMVSLDKPLNEEGQTGRDILPDKSKPIEELLDSAMIRDDVENNGFGEKEKAVFFLLAEGRTAREAGRRLNISHVMVLKYKKKLIKNIRRVTRRAHSLLV